MLGAMLAVGSASAPSAAEIVTFDCPYVETNVLTAVTPNVYNGDFSPIHLAALRVFLNSSVSDRSFLYTFDLPTAQCCRILDATLTLQLSSNKAGTAATTPDAGDDRYAILADPALSGPLYSSWPFAINLQTTKTVQMTAVAIAKMNATKRLSLIIQDDTKIISAKLRIRRCCLQKQI